MCFSWLERDDVNDKITPYSLAGSCPGYGGRISSRLTSGDREAASRHLEVHQPR